MKIRSVGAELFHHDGQTDMTKLTSAFRNFSNALQNEKYFSKLKLTVYRTTIILSALC